MAEAKETKQVVKKEAKPKATAVKAAAKPKVKAPEVAEIVETPVEAVTETPKATEEPKIAKAGKRSAKAIKEVEEVKAKEERKAHASDEPQAKKGAAPKTRSKLERRSKGYRKAAEAIEAGKTYDLKEACELATKTSPVKFDASVEIHIRLGVDPRQADQNIRETVVLPSGTGKELRVAVFAPTDLHDKAKQAGADVIGEADFLEQLKKEVINFDVLIATPDVMAQLSRFAKLLGPKGLMPNPKSGTVTKDVAKAVKQAKAGRVELRVDSQGIVHCRIGKVSFGTDKLLANAEAVMSTLKSARPSAIKGNYLETITVTTAMGPGIPVAV